MKQSTENKLARIYTKYTNGNKWEAARMVRGLTKLELFYCVSSNNVLVIDEFIDNSNLRYSFENFICNSLEGLYSN